jgi:hypothetical protein
LVDFYALKTHAESMPRRLFLEADIHLHVCRRIKQRPCQVCCLDVSILLAMCYIDSVILAGPLNYPRAGPPLSKMGRGFHFEFALPQFAVPSSRFTRTATGEMLTAGPITPPASADGAGENP